MRNHALTALPDTSSAAGNQHPAGLVHYAVLGGAIVAILYFAWNGFIAYDDRFYVDAAAGWVYHFPYVAQTFAETRNVVVLGVAAMFKLFGENEFTVVLSTSLFFVAIAFLTLYVLSRLVGALPATIALVVLSTLPIFALKATILGADVPELLFVATSFWLFWAATQRDDRFWLLIGAGAAAALAFSAHEVAGALIIYYGILFLAGFAIPRRQYWIMAIGFLAIVAMEAMYYAAVVGEPWRRFTLLFSTLSAGGSDRGAASFLGVATGGTIHFNSYLDPFLMFFTKHEFGILGFLSVPALWWSYRLDTSQQPLLARTTHLLAVLALVWFLFSAIMLTRMILFPRYYLVTTYCLAVIVALWAIVDVWPRRPVLAAVTTALFVLVNGLAIYVDNKNPLFGERALIEYLGMSSGPVYTDPRTANDLGWLCRWERTDCDRILIGKPAPGRVFFRNPSNDEKSKGLWKKLAVTDYRVPAGSAEIWRKEEPAKGAALVIKQLGVAGVLPPAVYRKLVEPNPPVSVFRVPDIPADAAPGGNGREVGRPE